jgi:ferredoxin-NADP reductase
MRDAKSIERARDALRDSVAEFESGAAAHVALSAGPQASARGLDWFRGQMNLPAGARERAALWLGLTPAHLLLMTVLLMLAAGFIVLTLVRRRRIAAVLRTAADAHTVKAPVSSPAPASAPRASPSPSPEPAPAASPGATPLEPATVTAALPPARRGQWAGELRVAQVIHETPTVSTFRFVNPAGDRMPFDFAPGQFLQVEVEPRPGSPVKRSYTIASAPTRSAYVELTVKREEHGIVSAHLHDHIKIGDRVKLAGPFGVFTFNGSDADSIVLIAGGVGITPMMSVLRYLTDTAWPGEIFFIYSARSPDEIVFREEIEYLERRHPNLHTLVVVSGRPAGTSWLGPEGLLTRELLMNEVPDIASRRIHLCGPPPMMAAVRQQLAELGVPDAQIRTEAFGPASLPTHEPLPETAAPAPPAAPAVGVPAKDVTPRIAPATVTFSHAGIAAPLPADTTILEAAEGAGVEIPYSCRSGVCGVCVVRLTRGDVTMAVEEGLDPADKARGYVLACQAKSCGSDLVVEA